MFRVPASADAPSFDQTFSVGFFRWLTSSAADREEWTTRRNIAAQLARENQVAAADQSIAARREQFGRDLVAMQARAGQLRAELRAARRARRRRY